MRKSYECLCYCLVIISSSEVNHLLKEIFGALVKNTVAADRIQPRRQIHMEVYLGLLHQTLHKILPESPDNVLFSMSVEGTAKGTGLQVQKDEFKT